MKISYIKLVQARRQKEEKTKKKYSKYNKTPKKETHPSDTLIFSLHSIRSPTPPASDAAIDPTVRLLSKAVECQLSNSPPPFSFLLHILLVLSVLLFTSF
uniref:Uncharacterized protein n=1 Tax=Opuntia streptacantha TaxID=393608 RepID=A0A7C8ZW28_OPUST